MKNKILATAVALGVAAVLIAIPGSASATTKCLTGPYNDGVCQSKSVKPDLSKASASGWKSGKLAIAFTLTDKAEGAYYMSSITLTLPSGMTWSSFKDVSLSGDKYTAKTSDGGREAKFTLSSPDNEFAVTVKAGAIAETKAAKKDKSISISLDVENDNSNSFSYSFS